MVIAASVEVKHAGARNEKNSALLRVLVHPLRGQLVVPVDCLPLHAEAHDPAITIPYVDDVARVEILEQVKHGGTARGVDMAIDLGKARLAGLGAQVIPRHVSPPVGGVRVLRAVEGKALDRSINAYRRNNDLLGPARRDEDLGWVSGGGREGCGAENERQGAYEDAEGDRPQHVLLPGKDCDHILAEDER